MQSIAAKLGDRDVLILDLSASNALVEHAFTLTGDETRLTFDWEGEALALNCRAGKPELQGSLSDREQRLIYHTRFEFRGDTRDLVRGIATHGRRINEAREANSAGIPAETDETIDDIGRSLRARRIGFVSFVMREGKWRRFETMSADQPLNGFTVGAYEDEAQLRLLCLAYEEADADGRALLRQFAAESIKVNGKT
jgi:hypothetical protein